MNKIAATLVLIVMMGVAYAGDYEITKKTGDYTVLLKIDKNPPVVGNNNVTVEIKGASGTYITDARVVIDYSMPAMMGMPAMNYKADAGANGKEYEARMNLSMAGSWNVAVKITRAGKTSTAKFTLDAK